MTYTRNTPLLVNGEDIITVLDREDSLLSKNVSDSIHHHVLILILL